MASDWKQYSFYRILEVDPEAGAEEIKNAHHTLSSTLDPDGKPDEQKEAAAVALIIADAALDVLLDDDSRRAYDAKLKEVQEAESKKTKIEAKREGKLQEEQSIDEDEKLRKATQRHESARNALADYYYDRLFHTAKQCRFETIPQEQLMEWLIAERAESIRKAEQKGRKTSFRIDWQGFASVQDTRKRRSEEITGIVDRLVEELQLP